jgi:hypothetical protein
MHDHMNIKIHQLCFSIMAKIRKKWITEMKKYCLTQGKIQYTATHRFQHLLLTNI